MLDRNSWNSWNWRTRSILWWFYRRFTLDDRSGSNYYRGIQLKIAIFKCFVKIKFFAFLFLKECDLVFGDEGCYSNAPSSLQPLMSTPVPQRNTRHHENEIETHELSINEAKKKTPLKLNPRVSVRTKNLVQSIWKNQII